MGLMGFPAAVKHEGVGPGRSFRRRSDLGGTLTKTNTLVPAAMGAELWCGLCGDCSVA